jgi:hypothetical protein
MGYCVNLPPYKSAIANHSHLWLRREVKQPERPRHAIAAKILLVAMANTGMGFHLVGIVSNGSAIDTNCTRGHLPTAQRRVGSIPFFTQRMKKWDRFERPRFSRRKRPMARHGPSHVKH